MQTNRDSAVHKIFVRKLHRATQVCPHTALPRKKFVNLLHRKYYRKSKYNGYRFLLNTNTVAYCMQNYKSNRLAPMVHLMLAKQ